jgi:hypothetical protein
MLKDALVRAPIILKPNFTKPKLFGVGANLSQKKEEMNKLYLMQTKDNNLKEVPFNGRQMLCIDTGHCAFLTLNVLKSLYPTH